MLADQDGRCAICMRRPRNRRLAVDHDHFTGLPRALLCYTCNKALGWYEFDAMVAYNAARYLLAIYESLRHSLVEADSEAGGELWPGVSPLTPANAPSPSQPKNALKPMKLARQPSKLT